MDVLQLVAREIDKEVTAIQEDMILGGCKDLSDYKFHCGRVRGLLAAKGHIMEIAKGYEEDE